ncbi:MAG: polysaccharide biosynthesis/export family protein [Planctomycetota bacterium]
MAVDEQHTEALLAAYIDGELDAEQRAAVEASLAKRPSHAAMVDQMRRARALVKGLPTEPAPVGLADDVLGQLERAALLEPAGLAIKPARQRPLALAAAVVLLLAGGLVAFVLFGLPEPNESVKTAASDSATRGGIGGDIDEVPGEETDAGSPVMDEPEVDVDGTPTPSLPPDEPVDGEDDPTPTFTRDMFAADTPSRIGGGRLPGGLWFDLQPRNPLDTRPRNPLDIDPNPSLAAGPANERVRPVMVIAETVDSAAVQAEIERFIADQGLVVQSNADGTFALRMSRRDALMLADALASAERVTLLNAEASAGGLIEPGETLRVELIKRNDPTQAEAVDVEVRPDGTVRVVGGLAREVGPLPAAGATEQELADALESQLGEDGPLQVNVRRQSNGQVTPVDPDRRIKPGDRLEIALGDVSEVRVVDAAGMVSVPELDPIFASGFRPQELANLIDYQYREGFIGAEPKVRVSFADPPMPPGGDAVVDTLIVIRPVLPAAPK